MLERIAILESAASVARFDGGTAGCRIGLTGDTPLTRDARYELAGSYAFPSGLVQLKYRRPSESREARAAPSAVET